MRAVVFEEFGKDAAVRQVADPVPPRDGVVVRVGATGLCRSDWHAWQGHDRDVRLPHYLLGGPAMGRPAFGVGMTVSPCRSHVLGGGVTGSGGIDRPLIRGMTTGFFAGREALRNVDVAIGAVGRPGEDDRRTHVIDVSDIGAFLGLDVGKGEHHATAVTPAGKKAFDGRLPNSEPKLREVFGKLQAKHGTVLVVVDQLASIGALPPAVARDMGCPVASLPGLTMRRIADLYPGEAKTDARDAFVIADAARVMPHTLRSVDLQDETIAELEMVVGFDDDLAGEATRISNRLRGLLTQIHPSLERVLGPRVQHPAVLKLLDQFGSPALIRKAGRRGSLR